MNPTVSSDSLEVFEAPDYDLGATLNSGQAFRWQAHGTGWVGIIAGRTVTSHEAERPFPVAVNIIPGGVAVMYVRNK